MRTAGWVFLIAIAVGSWQAPAGTGFDPVGRWRVSTQSDDGAPMTVDVEIAGKPGAYRGKAVTSLARELPLTDLATTPIGMIAVFALPQGSVVVRISTGTDGKFRGDWGAIPVAVGLTAERVK